MSVSPFEFEILFALLSGKLSTAITRKLYRRFREEEIEVTPEQWIVLHQLWNKEGVTQQELCVNTFKDKPSMTRLIDNLERQSLVERRTNKEDRRINMIYLTPEGKNMKQKIYPIVTRSMQMAFEGISDDDLELLRKGMSKIFNNIKKSLEE